MQRLRELITPALTKALADAGLEPGQSSALLQESRHSAAGDLSLPCFTFSKVLAAAPQQIAEDLASRFEAELSGAAESAVGEVVANSGYLNIFADVGWLASWRIAEVLADPENAGRALRNQSTVLIEHTSANPNGPFHVGRARNAILGDGLVRLHRVYGDDVIAEYYIDDMGKQVGLLAWAISNLDQATVSLTLSEEGIAEESNHPEKADHQRVRYYQAANLLSMRQGEQGADGRHRDVSDTTTIQEQVTELVLLSEEGDQKTLELFEEAYQPVLSGMLETLERLRIGFDSFTRESRFILDGSVAEVMLRLRSSDLCEEAENGALFLELETKGVSGKSTRFFFQRGDGSSLYASRDIAYHQWKWGRADVLINVLGEDHRLQSKQVSIALEELGIEAPRVVFYAFIKLPDGKMSTRRGNVVFMDDLLDEGAKQAGELLRERRPELETESAALICEAVATSSIRFNILKVSPEKGFSFRWKEALSFEADSAPFIMYSHARSCSISAKLESAGHSSKEFLRSWKESQPGDIAGSGRDMLRVMARFEDAVARAVELHKPSHFCTYLLELASSYNAFYRDCPVMDGQGVNAFNLALNECCKHLLRTACEALGITALESM